MKSSDALKSRAEQVFRKVSEIARPAAEKEAADGKPASQSRPVETTEGAMDEYKARQEAERSKMTKLRELRLAAEAKVAGEPKPEAKVKRKAGGKAKR
jgi:hypothetical protein